MNKHFRILGWIYSVTCGLALALGLALCVPLALQSSVSNQKTLQFIGPPFLIVACVWLIPGLIGGIGLLRAQSWARALLLLLSVLLLPLLPIGSVLGMYGFWTLLRSESAVQSRLPTPSPFLSLLLVMAGVGAGFFFVIKIGFIIHHEPQPAVFENATLTATAALILFACAVMATLLLIQSGEKAMTKAQMRKKMEEVLSEQTRARYRRAAELAADPKRARYAPLVERGETWTDEHIAYDEDPDKTVTCDHLCPIERALRVAGVDVRFYQNTDVVAQCRIDFPALQRIFNTAPPVRYAEFYAGERDADDFPTAFLICDIHKSMIHTLHPEQAGAKKTPWFPTSESTRL